MLNKRFTQNNIRRFKLNMKNMSKDYHQLLNDLIYKEDLKILQETPRLCVCEHCQTQQYLPDEI